MPASPDPGTAAPSQVLAAWTRRMLDETSPAWRDGGLPPGLRAPGKLRGGAWFIPHGDMIALWGAYAEDHGDPIYGLRFAERSTLAVLGPITQLVAFAPTLGHLVATYGSVGRLLDSGNLTQLEIEDDALVLADRPPATEGPWPRQLAESILGAYVHAVRASIDGPLELRAVEFVHPRPPCADAVEAWFGAPVRFAAAENRIVADAAALCLPMRSGSAPGFSRIRETIAALGRRLLPDDRIALQVRASLLRNDGDVRVRPVEAVARELGMSSRTLQRRLGEAGVSFRRLLDDVRAELVGDAPPGKRIELARRLGFADDSALRKFLRRTPP